MRKGRKQAARCRVVSAGPSRPHNGSTTGVPSVDLPIGCGYDYLHREPLGMAIASEGCWRWNLVSTLAFHFLRGARGPLTGSATRLVESNPSSRRRQNGWS